MPMFTHTKVKNVSTNAPATSLPNMLCAHVAIYSPR